MPCKPTVTCPLCGQKATREHFTIQINENEKVIIEINLFDLFKHIEHQDEEIKELLGLLKKYAFLKPQMD